jgi:hypothetical protein
LATAGHLEPVVNLLEHLMDTGAVLIDQDIVGSGGQVSQDLLIIMNELGLG